MQASTCIPTLGTICVALGAILYAAFFKHSAEINGYEGLIRVSL
jgi:hypothetical protein